MILPAVSQSNASQLAIQGSVPAIQDGKGFVIHFAARSSCSTAPESCPRLVKWGGSLAGGWKFLTIGVRFRREIAPKRALPTRRSQEVKKGAKSEVKDSAGSWKDMSSNSLSLSEEPLLRPEPR